MKFSPSHEWITVNGKTGTVGVSQYAQKELGDIVYVELPKVGQKVAKGAEVAVLESTKAAADVYAPVSGTIIDVNANLSEAPDLINKSPEQDGWLFQIELSHISELDDLLTPDSYREMVGKKR